MRSRCRSRLRPELDEETPGENLDHAAAIRAARNLPADLLRKLSANYAQGEPWRTTALDEPGNLMPVDVIGLGLGQRPGDPQPPELSYPPFVHEALLPPAEPGLWGRSA